MSASPELRIGCSGWQYASWRGTFYPAGLKTADWFEFYAREFNTVEVNNTFYRLPERSVFEQWRSRSPVGFQFSIKGSRYLTHLKRLKAPSAPLERLYRRAFALGDRLGPVLFQLPPQFRYDLGRLRTFLRAWTRVPARLRRASPRQLPPLRAALEFRSPDWYRDDVFELLSGAGVGLCLHDRSGSATPRIRVGPIVYLRFHGTSGRYQGSYTESSLREWAEWLKRQWRDGADVYAYFNNDPEATAVRNARTLRALTRQSI
jgi:uncharacterized protein YecE (DUF72 family)